MRADLGAFGVADAEAVLDPNATGDALTLCSIAPDLATDVEVLYAAGWLFWCRALESGEEDRDLSLAVGLLYLLWYIHPEMVPPAVRTAMERDGGTPEAEREEGVEASLRLWSWYQETSEDNALIAAIRLLRHEIMRLHPQSENHQVAVKLVALLLEKWHESHADEPAPEEGTLGNSIREAVADLRARGWTGEDAAERCMDLCENGLALLGESEDKAARIDLTEMLATTIVAVLEGDLPYRLISGWEPRVMRERAIGLLVSMLDDLPEDYPDARRALMHSYLTVLYRARVIGSITSNEGNAIKHGRMAVALADPEVDREVWAIALEKLATVYVTGFTGDRAERIDEGIGMLEEVISGLDDEVGSELWCRVMFNLGEAYSNRPHEDRAVDLVKAEQVFSRLADVETLETNPAGWAQTQSGLAGVRYRQFDADGTLRFLRLAEEGYRRAAIDPPPVHYQLLAGAYGQKDDAEQEISVLREQLDLISREVYPVRWARSAARLAETIRESAPDEAYELLLEAAEALAGEPAAARDHAFVSGSLARVLLGRDSPHHLQKAISLLEAAAEALQGDLPELYVQICDDLGSAYAKVGNWPQATSAFGAAVEALDRHYQTLLIFRSRAEEASRLSSRTPPCGLRPRAVRVCSRLAAHA